MQPVNTPLPPPVTHYENFPVASWLCPPHLRAPIAAIYAFARTADDIADEGPANAAQRLADLAAYRADLHAIAAAQAPSERWSAVFAPLAAMLKSHALPSYGRKRARQQAHAFGLRNAGQQHIVFFWFFNILRGKAHMGKQAAHVVKKCGIRLAPKPEKTPAVHILQTHALSILLFVGLCPGYCPGFGQCCQQGFRIGQGAHAQPGGIEGQGNKGCVEPALTNRARH